MSFDRCMSLLQLHDKLPVLDIRDVAQAYQKSDGLTYAEALERAVTDHLEHARAEEAHILRTVADAHAARTGQPAAPQQSAGEKMRARVKGENPFLAFLGEHGVHVDERSDTGGEKNKPPMVPGYGAMYRKSGARLDELAQRAHEAGFLSDQDMSNPADNGGTRKLADMIERAAVPDSDAELMAEAQKLGIETAGKSADQVYDEVVAAHAESFTDHEAQLAADMARDADIPLDGGKPDHNLTDEEIDAIFGIRAANDAAAGGAKTESDSSTDARGRAGETGAADEGASAAGVGERKDDPYTRDLFGGQDLFDDIAVRPGTTDAQKQTARAAVSDLARRLGIDRINRRDHPGGERVSVLGSRLLANFIAGKPNQLVGQHAKTPADLAVLAQVYRDPRFETFRVFYTDRTGKIVGEAGYTSRLAASVTMPNDLLQQVHDDKARFGASGYYLLHNHPSGKSEPSRADINLTQIVDKHIPGFQGHVVIDHNEYSVIHNWGEETIKAPHLNGRNFTGMPEMEHAMLGVKLTGPESVARAAKALQVPDGHATLILTTAPGETQLLVDVPMAALAKGVTGDGITRVKALVRRMTRTAGAGGNRFIVLPNGADIKAPAFVKMLAHGVVTDVVNAGGQSLQGEGFYHGGDFINKTRGKAIRVAELASRRTLSGSLDMQRALYDGRDSILTKGDRLAVNPLDVEHKLTDDEFDSVQGSWQSSVGIPLSDADASKVIDRVNATPWFHGSRLTDLDELGLQSAGGLFLTSDAGTASHYAGLDGKTYARTIDVRNPFFVAHSDVTRSMESSGEIERLKAQGFDAIVPLDYDDIVLLDRSAINDQDSHSVAEPADQYGERSGEDRRVKPRNDDDRRTIEVDGVRHPIRDSQGRMIGRGDFMKQTEFWRNYKGEVDERGRPILPDDTDLAAHEPSVGYGSEEPDVPDNLRTRLARMIGRPVAQLRSAAHDVVSLANPMAVGASKAKAIAKDFANNMRAATAQWNAFDAVLRKNYNEAQLRKMWDAADQENDLRREGKTASDKGLNALPADQRETVELLHAYGEQLWDRAKKAGLVDPDSEGVAYWTPRVAANIYADGSVDSIRPQAGEFSKEAKNLKTSASSTKQRKYETTAESEAALKAKLGDDAAYVKNIRVMPMAMAQLEKAITGRTLVNQIKAHGQAVGAELISETGGKGFVTFDHPALKRWLPKTDWQPVDDAKIAERGLDVRADGVYKDDEKLATYRVRDGKAQQLRPMLDSEGKPILLPAPLFVHKDFAGPLRAVFTSSLGNETVDKVYRGMMALKGASMSMIMVSPATHNAVIWGKAMPSLISSMGWKSNLKNIGTLGAYTYYMGHQYRQDHALFSELVKGGLVPIGGRGMNTDVAAIAEGLKPGRSLMAKALGAVLDVTEPVTGPVARVAGKAVDAVAVPVGRAIGNTGKALGDNIAGRAINRTGHTIAKTGGVVAKMGTGDGMRENVDDLGHFWHETLLWDRIGDMQVGMAVQLRNHFMDSGVDQYTATRIATFFANRYAGAVPQEAMSQGAHALLNTMLFSKSFTMTNLGAMKDPVMGLPGDVRAQIREHFAAMNRALGKTDIEAEDAAGKVLKQAQAITRKKAGMILMADFGAMAIVTSLMQAWMNGDDGKKFVGDLRERAGKLGAKIKDDPTYPLPFIGHPFDALESLSQTHDNPHGKQDRIRLGEDEHGNSYYMRLPVGKVVEEMKSYLNLSSASDLIDAKASPLMKGITEAKQNKDFYGRSVYDKDANLLVQTGQVVGHIMKTQVPFDDMTALKNIVNGDRHQGGKVHVFGRDLDMDQAKLLGTATGLSVSKLTGGDALAEMRYQEREHQGKVNDIMPDVKDAVMRGDVDKATEMMEKAGMDDKEIERTLNRIEDPGAISKGRMKKFEQHASDEELNRLDKMMNR